MYIFQIFFFFVKKIRFVFLDGVFLLFYILFGFRLYHPYYIDFDLLTDHSYSN